MADNFIKQSAKLNELPLNQVGPILTQLKLELIKFSLFDPSISPQILLAARNLLEVGALYSASLGDLKSFTTYFTQLKTYYFDLSSLAPSPRMFQIFGLDLVRLLAENKISEFHSSLEKFHPKDLLTNPFIIYAIQLEQALMEGSYGKVISQTSWPLPEYQPFYQILVLTAKEQIALCTEQAYKEISKERFFNKLGSSSERPKEWQVNIAGNFYFPENDQQFVHLKIDPKETMKQILCYAQQVENIV